MQTLKEEVRKKILKSARKEFLKHGYNGASMRRIAKSAGYTVGNIYRYYKGKEDLFIGVTGNGELTENLYNEDKDVFMMLAEKKFTKKQLIEKIMGISGPQSLI